MSGGGAAAAAALDGPALDTLFRTARTFTRFTDEPVDDAQLHAIWELMKWGPTSANQMPARIIWCRSAEAKRRLADCASDSNAAKILAAPVTAIVAMDMRFYDELPRLFPHADARAWFVGKDALIEQSAFRNATLQGAYLILAARALGLDAGPMSGFDNAAVDAAFLDGTSWRSNFITMIGHGDRGALHPRLPKPAFEDHNRIV